MKKRMKTVVLLILMLTLVLSCAPAALADASVGEVCPDFSLTTLSGGTFRLSDYRGKVVFVNIWATWCGPCVSEMPDIQRLQDTYSDLVVLGVSVDNTASIARSFIRQYGYTYAMAMDDSYYTVTGRIFPSRYIPYSIFINPDGVVTYMDSGSMSYSRMDSLYRNAKASARPTAEPTATPEPVRTPGDVTGDGAVDGRDLLRLTRFIAGNDVTIDAAAADMNGDGKVDGRDVLRLAKQLAGL